MKEMCNEPMESGQRDDPLQIVRVLKILLKGSAVKTVLLALSGYTKHPE
jgi:hypothetical protein